MDFHQQTLTYINFEFKYNWKADPTGPEAVVKVFLLIYCIIFSSFFLRGIEACPAPCDDVVVLNSQLNQSLSQAAR